MRISEMIEALERIKREHGNLLIVGGYIADDTPPRSLTVVNTDGCDFKEYGGEIEGVYISC